MGTLYLVRHGQASFGEADYDRLSPMGHQQSRRLGEYFAGQGLVFDAVITGTLRRHAETFAGRPREGRPFDFANHDWEEGETGLPLVRDATSAPIDSRPRRTIRIEMTIARTGR